MKRACLVVLGALLWLTVAAVALADDGPMYVVANGGSVQPMKETNIRMAAETVQAVCYSRFAEYRVDFRFDNSATTKTVLLGFPFVAPHLPMYPGDQYLAPAGFRAWQDGRPLKVTLVHGHEGDSPVDYYTHRAVFPHGESTVTVTYLVSPYLGSFSELADWADVTSGEVSATPAAYSKELIGEGAYNYTLHTAWYWDGYIDTAVLRWMLSPDFVGWGVEQDTKYETTEDTSDPSNPPDDWTTMYDRIQSGYMTPSPGVYQWTFHDFTPDLYDDNTSPYDIGLLYFAPPVDRNKGYPNRYALPSAHASSSLKLGSHAYPPSNLIDGDPSTAWAEGADGSGVGQWVDVTLPQKRELRELRILPGYAKRPDLFAKYNRPKTLRFDFSDGTSATVTLTDAPALQRFPVSAAADKVRVTILDVYRGTTRNETYVSEIDFGQGPAPTFVDPGTLLTNARDVASADAPPLPRARPVFGPIAPQLRPAPTPDPGSRTAGLLSLAAIGVAVVVIWRLTP